MRSPLTQLILAFLVCAAALVGYGIWYAAIANQSIAASALQSQIDVKTATISQMASTRAALAEIAGDESVVQGYFVPETGVVTFIDGLESRGRSLGANVGVLSVSTGGAPARPVLLFSLSITGTFDAVMRTVGAIEYAPYDISVSALTLEQSDKNSWHADLKLLVGSVVAGAATTTP